MTDLLTGVPSCIEHERLALELLELRTRGQCLSRLRPLSLEERAEWDWRELVALARLVNHDLEHGAAVEDIRGRKGEKRVGILEYERANFL